LYFAKDAEDRYVAFEYLTKGLKKDPYNPFLETKFSEFVRIVKSRRELTRTFFSYISIDWREEFDLKEGNLLLAEYPDDFHN
jgi:hypothetical protein